MDKNIIEHDHNHDGIDRRGFLKCMLGPELARFVSFRVAS